MPSDSSTNNKSGVFREQTTHQDTNSLVTNCRVILNDISVKSSEKESTTSSVSKDLHVPSFASDSSISEVAESEDWSEVEDSEGGSEVEASEGGSEVEKSESVSEVEESEASQNPITTPVSTTVPLQAIGTVREDSTAKNIVNDKYVAQPLVTDNKSPQLLVFSNNNHTQSKQKNDSDEAKNVLLIGGDLLISKSENVPGENIGQRSTKELNRSDSKSIPSGSIYNSLTIKTINYKCRVLQEHSRVCACGAPRLHEYLSNNHRCCSNCVAVQSTSAVTAATHVLSVSHTPEMTGRSRGASQGKKSIVPNILRKSRHSAGGTRKKRNLQAGTILARHSIETSGVSSHESDEPESELLIEEECEWLPTAIDSLECVEYIVLDDDTLNLSATNSGMISSDTLQSKINTIYKDIDDKIDTSITEKSAATKEIKSRTVTVRRASEPISQWTTGRGGHNQEKEDGGCEDSIKQSLDDLGSSSLADVCTNHSPSIKDIFGDVNIKEEPLEDAKQDMSIDDFSKEISNVSDVTNNSNDAVIPKEKEYEGTSKGLFAKLIKEENSVNEMNIDEESSDDSLAPLQIDERFVSPVDDIEVNAPPKEASEYNLPSVNIISPFKIKILLGSPPTQEAQLIPKEGSDNVSNIPTLYITKPVSTGSEEPAARQEKLYVRKGVSSLPVPVKDPPAVTTGIGSNVIQSLTCNYCHTTCSNDQALKLHFENHQKEGLIICYFCQKSFGDKTGMRRHMRTHTGEKPYQCKVCGKRFSLPGNFKKHRDIHEDRRTEPCSICAKTFRRKEHLKYHMRTHTGEKPYTCSECGTSFTARYSLQIHMNIHLGKKPYKCTYCSKAFSDKSTMRKHVRVHTGEKPFRCQVCRRCFGESGTLAAHMATHRSDRPYQCDKCVLRFKTTGGLRQHEKVHSGEKQFACRYCGMKFLQKYNMTMHERIHTGEKPYTCSHCDRSFRSRSCLAKHVVLHGGDDERRFGCDHCSSRFYRKAHLRRHIDMHLGIKNYECTSCAKKFCTRGTLKNHLKTFHSHGARRFPCNWCGRVFKRKIYVTTHVCTGNPIKKEGEVDETLDDQQLKDEEGYNSTDSEASTVDVKSEPEDEIMENDKIEDTDYEFGEGKEKEILGLDAGECFYQATGQNPS
ncbi:hypothetical protein Pcinc_030530 [Petrolisthes cinctipes]|uniref:C2H2-type domain-containing protein n=1 Tax=Petrolisthes cinctipes TaxID=88211 RepID=A0AAE1EYK6_PETCI|nr:hypothetical protein Pcinc_030530 [Petrolisthes cinctipes]